MSLWKKVVGKTAQRGAASELLRKNGGRFEQK
jgi:hypothetical protein